MLRHVDKKHKSNHLFPPFNLNYCLLKRIGLSEGVVAIQLL